MTNSIENLVANFELNQAIMEEHGISMTTLAEAVENFENLIEANETEAPTSESVVSSNYLCRLGRSLALVEVSRSGRELIWRFGRVPEA